MDLNNFISTLLHTLTGTEFVEKVDFDREVFILRGKIILKKNFILQVYFNEVTQTTAFALIEYDKRVWGIDFDKTRGWHIHPLEDPQSHILSDPLSIEEIIDLLKIVWLNKDKTS